MFERGRANGDGELIRNLVGVKDDPNVDVPLGLLGSMVSNYMG